MIMQKSLRLLFLVFLFSISSISQGQYLTYTNEKVPKIIIEDSLSKIMFNSIVDGKANGNEFVLISPKSQIKKEIIISVKQPFYMGWEFYLLIVSVFLLISFFYYRYRLATTRKEYDELIDKLKSDYSAKLEAVQPVVNENDGGVISGKSVNENIVDAAKALSKKEEFRSADDKFLSLARELVDRNLSDSSFNSSEFESQLKMSHAVIYRQMKRLTGMSSNEYIRDIRLKTAAKLIENETNLRMVDISTKVGFSDSRYFSQCFKKQYGITPTAYKKQHNS